MAANQERTVLLLGLFISTIVAVNLTISILSISGAFLSKNAQLTQNNAKLLENMLERSQAMGNGTIKTTGLNLSIENNQILHKILQNLANASQ